jgi:hypothetical protein
MSIGGIENDLQVYCLCEHHDGDEHQGYPGLTDHIRESLDRAGGRQQG